MQTCDSCSFFDICPLTFHHKKHDFPPNIKYFSLKTFIFHLNIYVKCNTETIFSKKQYFTPLICIPYFSPKVHVKYMQTPFACPMGVYYGQIWQSILYTRLEKNDSNLTVSRATELMMIPGWWSTSTLDKFVLISVNMLLLWNISVIVKYNSLIWS